MMAAAIPWLQAIAAITWGGCLVYVFPFAWRYLVRHEPTPRNVRSVLISYIALVQLGFPVRWLIYSDTIHQMGATEINFWAALWVCSSFGAITTTIAMYHGRFDT